MAKAKRKASTKKSKSKKNSSSKAAIITLAVALLAILAYTIYLTPSVSKKIIPTQETFEKIKNYRPKIDKKESEKDVEKKDRPEKFEVKKITALDGKVEKKSTNKALPVYSKDDNYYYKSSFDFAWPAYSSQDQIIEHDYYALSYNEKREQPDWVAYKLTKKNLNNARYKRKNNFRSDPEIQTGSAQISDYRGSGYDRGHLAPAADFTWSERALSESFFMSNMSPQKPGFNRGIWKNLEEKVRKWAKNNDELFIVTGPIYKGKINKIGKNKVAIPSHYYKVVLDLYGKEIKSIAFVFSNDKTNKSISSCALSIDELEEQTGLDFFPSIPDELEDQLEKQSNYSVW